MIAKKQTRKKWEDIEKSYVTGEIKCDNAKERKKITINVNKWKGKWNIIYGTTYKK